MNKLFLLISLILIAPICQANPNDKPKGILRTAKQSKFSVVKKVSFASEPQVRTFKKDTSDAKTVHVEPKPSMHSRVSNGLLGIAMMWAGPFAAAQAIDALKGRDSGLSSFRGAVIAGALISCAIVTIAGFEKVKSAIWA